MSCPTSLCSLLIYSVDFYTVVIKFYFGVLLCFIQCFNFFENYFNFEIKKKLTGFGVFMKVKIFVGLFVIAQINFIIDFKAAIEFIMKAIIIVKVTKIC